MGIRLIVTAGPDMGRVFELGSGDSLVVGRGLGCDIQLNDPRVSKTHCRIYARGRRTRIVDASSRWGTVVNGQQVAEHQLQPGDTITLGATELRVVAVGGATAGTPAPEDGRREPIPGDDQREPARKALPLPKPMTEHQAESCPKAYRPAGRSRGAGPEAPRKRKPLPAVSSGSAARPIRISSDPAKGGEGRLRSPKADRSPTEATRACSWFAHLVVVIALTAMIALGLLIRALVVSPRSDGRSLTGLSDNALVERPVLARPHDQPASTRGGNDWVGEQIAALDAGGPAKQGASAEKPSARLVATRSTEAPERAVPATAEQQPEPQLEPRTHSFSDQPEPTGTAPDGAWTSLFNGRDLRGWRGDPKLWRVENGAIAGEAPAGVISNLSTERTYEDFVLKLQFKLVTGNSGVMVRSRQLAGYMLTGPQANIPENLDWLALVYVPPTGGGSWMQRADRGQAVKHYRRNDWNEYVITCRGSHITVELNGHHTLDYVDRSGQVDRAGMIGLRLFAPVQPASVLFKDIRIRGVQPSDIVRVTPPHSRPPEPVTLPGPRPVALPDPMPDARFLELQEGNKSLKTRIRPKPLSELADNRIGDAQNPCLPFTLPPEGNPHLLEHAAYFGFRWYRVSRDAYDRDQVERTGYSRFDITPGQDRTVSLLSDNGIILLYTITYWDETLPGGQAHPRYRNEKEIQRYLDYARFIVRHFKGRVRYYEILNEPPMQLSDYINLCRRVVPVIRQEDPGAKIVIGGGMNPQHQWARDWMFRLVRSDVMPLVDGISFHPMYGVSPQYAETRDYYYGYPSFIQQIKAVAAAHGFRGEWIVEEMCWRTSINPHPHEPWQYTENVAAKYYARAIVMHLGMDFMTCIGGENWPLVAPIARVVQNLCTVMAGNRPTKLRIDIQSRAKRIIKWCTFSLPDGGRLIALWRDDIAADHDRGSRTTLIVKGFSAQKVTGIDILYSSEQQMKTDTEGGNLLIRNLLVKDYPIILRLTP